MANEFGRHFCATVIDYDDFEAWPIRLLRQGSQALIKGYPVAVNTNDNAEERSGC